MAAASLAIINVDTTVQDKAIEFPTDARLYFKARAALLRLRGSKALMVACDRPTPFSFPLMVERLREKLTTEQIEQRVARMVAELDGVATT